MPGSEKETANNAALEDYSYTTLTLGVWRLLLPMESSSLPSFKLSLPTNLSLPWNEIHEKLPLIALVWRFLTEIYFLDPILVILTCSLELGAGMDSVLMLYASTNLLKTVDDGLMKGHADVNAILRAMVIHIMCIAFTSTISWFKDQVTPVLETRVKLYFEEYMLNDKNTKQKVSSSDLWRAFQYLTGTAQDIFEFSAQIMFILQQANSGLIFTVLSLVGPAIATSGYRIFLQPFVTYSDNTNYLRLRSLAHLANDESFREEIVSSDIGTWISAEYRKARENLGNVSDAHPQYTLGQRQNPIKRLLISVFSDLPTLYWAATSILYPNSFSVTSFAILQQHAKTLNYTVQSIYVKWSYAAKSCSHIQDLYDMGAVENKLADGDEAYPSSQSSDNGMAFELRNVSFAYPEGKSKDNAIKNISLKIPAGQLVVIVGANGSGKSTIIKLLNRLYDVDSGEILVDGEPIKNYRISDLRKVQAMLTQEHKLYPLTLAENIGLGHPAQVDNMDMIVQAAESGGANGVIQRQVDGIQTILNPVSTARSGHLDRHKHKKLKEIFDGLEKKAEVSGGERQRLVASRTFMRFFSGNIRFAVADEPSSALDPKGEHQLFQRLRESRQGKTMIFVTHRFGHLTKHADLIICMKDGEAVETGTHKELMARGGEYFELYNVQAQAFADAVM
ncbi:lipid A export ATP-binding/permease protein MsbA [Favolaschia claudopus]|uniref:Lipid A export ATP-binding/permease protein MsbA n=1 Tax=Favolaschia claudopus TaxID=2862362 RepID=A0AAW0DYG7_9AGAR